MPEAVPDNLAPAASFPAKHLPRPLLTTALSWQGLTGELEWLNKWPALAALASSCSRAHEVF